jgi:acetyl-CoA carboxylase biotin carboxyl carrier protein
MGDDDDIEVQVVQALVGHAATLARTVGGPLRKVSVRAGDYAVEMEWETTITSVAAPVPGHHEIAPAAQASAPSADTSHLHAVVALLVGTFYRAPEPGSPPFVDVGDVVEVGQDVAIIEAMKVMNRIQADRAGRVVEILANDGEMVEFNQRLILLEPFEA